MIVIGIDLGTSNSAACIWRDSESLLIPNRMGEMLTPSVVSIENNHVVVGKRARERLITHPSVTIGAFKRLMGTDHTVALDKRHVFTATELSAIVLRSIKEDAEAFLGEPVDHAVLSVPAYFNETQRQATRLAGELAGLTVNRLINEPTAAALSYELHDRPEGTFMILDLGGGTFDVSVIEYFDGIMEVHASGGDNHLGGEDFVEVLRAAFLKDHGLDWDQLAPAEKQLLHNRMESAKRSIGPNAPFDTTLMLAGEDRSWHIDYAQMERLSAPLLLRIQGPIRQVLYDAGRGIEQIDDVVLVGGATRMHMFRSMVSKTFRRMPKIDRDPDLAIAMGAGV